MFYRRNVVCRSFAGRSNRFCIGWKGGGINETSNQNRSERCDLYLGTDHHSRKEELTGGAL